MATPEYQPKAGWQAGVAAHDAELERIKRRAMTPRQLKLNRYLAFYATEQYDERTVGWDGRKILTDGDRATISHTQVLPPGFWDPSGLLDEVPLSFRKPYAPYQLVRVVVNKFSGLLFSARMHPSLRVADNPAVQSWVEGIAKACHLWIRFAMARKLGGAMGSVGITFRFKAGRPVIEVHDPRWCAVQFSDRASGEVSRLEIRYLYEQEVRDLAGVPRTVWFWYRRIIDAESDTLFAPAPLGNGDEPVWQVGAQVKHGFGEFPGVWVRNTQTEDVDGEPDCHGCYESQEGIDALLSQAHQGAVENADPTLSIASDDLEVRDLKKGSRNAIKTEKGGSLAYLEMSGAGVRSALEVAKTERDNFLEVVQCVLDSDKTDGTMTATEVERRQSSMHDRGDLFREQYGEHGIKPLVAKMIRACAKVQSVGPVDPATKLAHVGVVTLPGVEDVPPEVLAKITDDVLELVWPEWVKRGPADASQAASAIATARTARVIDQESAVNYIAGFFGIDDPAAAMQRLREEGGALDDDLMKALIKAGQTPPDATVAAGGPPPGTGPAGQSPPKKPKSKVPPSGPEAAHPAADQPEPGPPPTQRAIVDDAPRR